jgi:fructoselysine-6-phosphate deglycase
MLNFDRDRYVAIQSGAMSVADPLAECVRARINSGGIDTLLFLGAGGAGILMLPAVQLLQARSSLTTLALNPAEFLESGCARLGSRTLVVAPSLSGTTAETEQALKLAASQGATTIALTGHAATPVYDAADFGFVNFAEDDTSSESFYLQSLVIALAAMDQLGELHDYETIVAELRLLPNLLVEVKEAFEGRAPALATALGSSPYHIITGAGSTWPQAHYYGMCILEEMQWIRTRPVDGADFFHGTLELVEPGVSVIIFEGEDYARPLTQRVAAFAQEHTDLVTVVDTLDFALPGVSPTVRALVSPVLLAAVLERVSAHLEVQRAHPLTTRRYYRRVAY